MFFCVLTTDSYMVLCVAKRNSMYVSWYNNALPETARASQGPVVRRSIGVNPGLNLNHDFFVQKPFWDNFLFSF